VPFVVNCDTTTPALRFLYPDTKFFQTPSSAEYFFDDVTSSTPTHPMLGCRRICRPHPLQFEEKLMKQLFSSLTLACVLAASTSVFAQDAMKQDNMKNDSATQNSTQQDSSKQDSMKNDSMSDGKKKPKTKKAAKQDAMKKDNMKNDNMKDGSKKDDNMKNDNMKNDQMKNDQPKSN
jgi:pentapeptide MXKDX repeat protein